MSMMTIGGITFDTSVQDNTYLGAKKKKEVDAWQASGTFYKPSTVKIPKYVVPNTQAYMPKPQAFISRQAPHALSYPQQVNQYKTQLHFLPMMKSNAPLAYKIGMAIPSLFGDVGNYLQGGIQDKNGNETIGNKFGGRVFDTARMAATGSNIARTTNKGDITTPMNTGSKIGNLGASLLGTGLGFGVSQPLGGQTLNSSMNKIGAPVENGILKATSKFGLKPNVLTKVGTSAIKTGSEFAGLNGAISLGRGDNVKQTLNNVGTGFVSGALFGAGGKAIGEASNFAKTMPKTSTLRQNVFDNKFGKIDNNNIPLQLGAGIPKRVIPTGGINDLGVNGGTIIAGGYKNGKKITVNPLAKNWAGKATTTTEKPSNVITPKFNKVASKTPKSDMVSANMSEFKMPNEFTKIKAPKIKTPEKYIAPTDVNGNPLPDPKIVSSIKDKSTLKQSVSKLYTSTVDNNNPTAKFSKVAKDNSYTLATNAVSHKDISNNIISEALVDKNGVKIGKSLKEVLNGLPKEKGVSMDNPNSFENYLMDKHNIARQGQNKPVKPNDSVEASTAKVLATEKLHPEWSAKAKELTTWINKFMDTWGVKAGTLDKGLYEANKKMYPNYVPTNREYSSLETLTKGNGATGYANQTMPIKKATGSARAIIDPRESIADMVMRTVKSAKNNEVFQSIVQSLRKTPEKLKGFAEIVPEPNGNAANVIRVLENGKPTYVQVNDEEFLKNILSLNKTNAGKAERTLRGVMNVPKALITHKNPIFGVRNVARDVPTAYVYGSEANPVKFGAKLLKSYYDIATNSKEFQQYKGIGGESGNFIDSNDTAKAIKGLVKTDNLFVKTLKSVPNGIEKFNSITESAPRFSEFKTVLKKTGDLQKALYAAKDVTTNFSRSGNFTKHVDSGVMYLNAGVQGLDKLRRQIKTKPLQTLGKGLVSVTAPALLLNKLNQNNPNYQELDNRSKDNYFNIPVGDKFIKIPKSRELGVLFGSLEERTARAFSGEKNPFKGFSNTVSTNFSPANPIDNSLFAPLFINLKSNKDFANRPIIPLGMTMDKRSPNLQFDEKSSEISKWFADKLKNVPLVPSFMKSPKQADYIMKSYLGGIAQVGLPANTKSLDTTKTTGQKAIDVIKQQFTSDPLYSNQSVTDFYDNFDKASQIATDKNINENIPSKTLTNEEALKSKFLKASAQMSKINKQIKVAISERDIRIYKQQIIDIAKEANKMVE